MLELSLLKAELAAVLKRQIHDTFAVEHEPVIQVPPRRELGDLAFPAALHLAKTLRRKPRDIATELAEAVRFPGIVLRVSVEGAGYLNLFLDRGRVTADLLETEVFGDPAGGERSEKIIVEHTNINPNKAAHIGHLRNAVLGDVLVRALRRLGHPVEIQNYIDDTGVQLADVVVAFTDLRGLDAAAVAALPEPFDYTCWDLYSEVGRWYEEDPERQALRRQTLHELEADEGPRAEMGRLVARRVVHRHLTTMRRLGIGYDVLTRESDILGLDFFTRAFEKLKASGAIHLEESGKNQGCWVMPLSQSAEFAGLEDPDKVIVRSDGTVTYVGKDIAYQLWKFGLLGRDFHYRKWGDEGLWETASEEGGGTHPAFGGGAKVINVIDARQSYLQKIVRVGLESLGHTEEAERSIHFAYEMVSLSKAAARQLGYLTGDGDGEQKSLEMSGRKGIGVKADDLLDQIEDKCRDNVSERYPDLDAESLDDLARQLATAALRFFMVKATTTRVIAFDFQDALSFEGETGPYLQYSMVRERNIRRKLEAAGMETEVDAETVRGLDAELWADDLWDLVLTAAQTAETVEKAAGSLELSMIARQALELAGKFHGVYHRHRILDEADPDLRRARMAAVQVFRKSSLALLDLLGVPVPEKM
ncbi:MAG: arginine--tRNA ligase [bacterium]|nr:arginine--tRNA ligase [bacterium]